jgi:hypothetical protein
MSGNATDQGASILDSNASMDSQGFENLQQESIDTSEKWEKDVAELLEAVAPGIIPVNETVLQREIPEAVRETLFSKDIKFRDKVSNIKPYLKQPRRDKMVLALPTLEKQVKKYDPTTFKFIELLYSLRCLVAVFPNSQKLVGRVIKHLDSSNLSEVTEKDLQDLLNALKKLRGLDAAYSCVISAASKVFYTVDGLAFDEFSQDLTVLEWEQVTANMNHIRLSFAETIREYATEFYQRNNSKNKKEVDKKKLDKEMNEARIPLYKILKLNLEDIHTDTRLEINAEIELEDSNKKIRYDRNVMLARVRKKILEAYRKDKTIDVVKYAKETYIGI